MRRLSHGVAKEIPGGFLKEEIPEPDTGAGLCPKAECGRGSPTSGERRVPKFRW